MGWHGDTPGTEYPCAGPRPRVAPAPAGMPGLTMLWFSYGLVSAALCLLRTMEEATVSKGQGYVMSHNF